MRKASTGTPNWDAMFKPVQIVDDQAHELGIAPGWWGATEEGKPMLGPYPSREAALVGITSHGMGDRPEGIEGFKEPDGPSRAS
ncbi:hypothetical protein GCM10010994_29120 [Chelatococcus reniformis]|uniref:Uncharacterized protein n=1 Tax=Chelatococcus reniformis TaxID=1494448 RepID=A0A916XFT1_9HYPH|nr:hypothetical protein GCM10010994_29120 [Chelatococcus reniformis]